MDNTLGYELSNFVRKKINKCMNYEKHYYTLITCAKNRTLTEGYENHHIIPKCIGGTDASSNLVRLTPEEHYTAHLLLVKIHNTPKLIYAAQMMVVSSKYARRNNKMYGWLKRRYIEICRQRTGKNNGSYGKLWYHNLDNLVAGKYLPGTEPQGWIKGRTPKKINKCNVCGTDTNTPLQHWCNSCRPKKEKTVFKSLKTKTEYSDKEKIDALLVNDGSIRKALLSLGLNDSGTHCRVMKKIKASLAQPD